MEQSLGRAKLFKVPKKLCFFEDISKELGILQEGAKLLLYSMNFVHACILCLKAEVLIGVLSRISIPYAGIILPLIIWIIIGELLLRESSFSTRLKITVIAFVIYLILQFIGLPGLIIGLAG